MNQNSSDHGTVRVRFAPSPTGFLHIGGVRVALFNWLYARQKGGKFLLRIEDTDLERSETQFTQDILSSMQWLGLTWDEEPLYQSQRLETYRKKASELVSQGHAYRCYCTEAEVQAGRDRATAEGRKPQYDRRCRTRQDQPKDLPYVIRAKIPLEGHSTFEDLIRGSIRVENQDLDDFVIIRSTGAPTYNLSVVVDDIESKITHILRGDDHINNTPKQLHLYSFFGSASPQFAHLPMILGSDKKKLSKRHGAVSANVYRQNGYLSEALLNYLARLGWSHGDQEIFSIQELIQFFSFDQVQKSSAVFNTEKLIWLNGSHIRSSRPENLLKEVLAIYPEFFTAESLNRANTPLGIQLVSLIQPKVKFLKDLADQLAPLCLPGVVEADASGLKWKADSKLVIQSAVRDVLNLLERKMEEAPHTRRDQADSHWGKSPSISEIGFSASDIEQLLRQVGDQHGVKLGDLAQPMRLVVTGRLISASLFDVIALMPWDILKVRLEKIAGF